MTATLDTKRKRPKDDEDASPNKRNNSEGEASTSTDKNTSACTSSGSEEKNIQSPYEIWSEKLEAFMASKPDIEDRLIISRFFRPKGEDDDVYDEDIDDSKYTTEELESIHNVMITENRSKMLDLIRAILLGDEADDRMNTFNGSFSDRVHNTFYDIKRRRSNLKSWSQKFDILFAYTFRIARCDSWMWDNEGDLNNGMVKELARLWKSTLKKSDEDLGIDGEYTRPGVIALLKQFKKDVESIDENYEPFEFNF